MFRKLIFALFFLLLCAPLYSQEDQDNNGIVNISGTLATDEMPDSLYLFVWDDLYSPYSMFDTPYHEYVSVLDKGHFGFSLSGIDQVKYIAIGYKGKKWVKRIIQSYLVEPGDNIRIRIMNESIHFEGAGSEKYKCKYAIDGVRKNYKAKLYASKAEIPDRDTSLSGVRKDLANSTKLGDSLRGEEIAALHRFKDKLTPRVFQVMEANLMGDIKQGLCRVWSDWLVMKGYQQHKQAVIDHINKNLYRIAIDQIPEEVLMRSYRYRQFLVARIGRFDSEPVPYDSFAYRYATIKKMYKGAVLDKLLTSFFLEYGSSITFRDSLLADALDVVATPVCGTILRDMYAHSRAGAPAFPFSLPDATGKYVSLTDLKDKVVFVDFWFTGCAGCSNYYETTVSKAKQYFAGNDQVAFVSISIDTDLDRWRKSIASNLYTSPKAINLYTEGKGSDHPLIKHYKISGYPTPMLFDRQGHIALKWAALRNGPDELIKSIQSELQRK